jgi:hypothetical protein
MGIKEWKKKSISDLKSEDDVVGVPTGKTVSAGLINVGSKILSGTRKAAETAGNEVLEGIDTFKKVGKEIIKRSGPFSGGTTLPKRR